MTDEPTTTKKARLSPIEVGAGAGAAVITAFATSYLGTAGTLTGAAIASVVGTVSVSVLRHSADTSAERLKATTTRLRQTRVRQTGVADIRPVESDGGLDSYGIEPPHAADWIDSETRTGIRPGQQEPTARRGARRRWVVLGAGAVAAFAVSLGAITGIEALAGKPLSGLAGTESGGGTTLGRATGSDADSGRPTTPGPTPTPGSTAGTGPASTLPASPTGGGSTTAPPPATPTSASQPPSATQPAPTQGSGAAPNPTTP